MAAVACEVPDMVNSSALLWKAGCSIEIWLPADWDQQIKNLQDADANAHRFSAFNLAADK